MVEIPNTILEQLRKYDQQHVLSWWPQLADAERLKLLEQLQAVAFPLLDELYQKKNEVWPVPAAEEIQPIAAQQLDAADPELRARGESLLREGRVAALVVAGGQGTRLGFDAPKGVFRIGPVSGKSLFQIHAEKVLAVGRRYGQPLHFLVMTSPATDQPTRDYFAENDFFGLAHNQVHFFCQGTMPALDYETGKLLMEAPDRLFTSPNGHGGVLLALKESGLLDELQSKGIEHLFYFQVDNPLVKVADPLFLGHHALTQSEISTKVIPKKSAADRLGNVVQVHGRCCIIEYSDLPQELAQARTENGELKFGIGSPAIHIFDLQFLRRILQQRSSLPFHLAKKKVPHLDGAGNRIEPETENALKFEMFIFDVLPLAQRWSVVQTTYEEEFAPLKNKTGADSPDEVRRAISDLAKKWFEQAGAKISASPRDEPIYVEISPLFALDAEDVLRKMEPRLSVTESRYFQ